MNFLALTNLLLILAFSQLYLYTSIIRIHLLLCFVLFCTLGTLIGVYNSFKTSNFIAPDLPSDQKLLQSSYLLSYEFYSDLILYLASDQKKTYPTQQSHLQRNNLVNRRNPSDPDYDIIEADDLNDDYKDFSEFEMHMMIFNDERTSENLLNSRYSKSSMSKSGSVNDSVFSEDVELVASKASESTSKLDTYLEEIVELIVRDFLMVNLEELLWDRERFSLMAR